MYAAGRGSRSVQGLSCLRSLGSCDRGFESHLEYGCLVCVRARLFYVCVVLYLGRGLATDRSLVQGDLPIVYRCKEKWKNLDTVRVRYKRNGYKKKRNLGKYDGMVMWLGWGEKQSI
jgi:hypothetical protein